ncbi:hypothetical protein L226DRAFT_616118, partial [Lentinus tigrinus ALCF2SS1-7]
MRADKPATHPSRLVNGLSLPTGTSLTARRSRVSRAQATPALGPPGAPATLDVDSEPRSVTGPPHYIRHPTSRKTQGTRTSAQAQALPPPSLAPRLSLRTEMSTTTRSVRTRSYEGEHEDKDVSDADDGGKRDDDDGDGDWGSEESVDGHGTRNRREMNSAGQTH